MAAPAAVLNILVRANTGPATSALYAVNAQLGATEKRATRLRGPFRAMEKAVVGSSVAVGAGLFYAVKKAAEFEQQMSRTAAVTPATAKQMKLLERQAIRLGRMTKFSALEAAEAQGELAKGGLSAARILSGGLQAALALAAAGEMEVADAATATVNAMKLFGLRGKDAMKVADQFATAANNTTADVDDFAWALRQGGSAAKAAGLDFTDTVAILEALADVGIRNSDAGTSLKTTLIQLARPTDRAQELMKKLHLSFFDSNGDMKSMTNIAGMLQKRLEPLNREQRLHAFAVLAGTDGMRTLNALFQAGPAQMEKYRHGLERQGVAAEVAKEKQDNLYGTLERLRGSIDSVAIGIGTAALPLLRRLATDADHTADRISRIVDRKDLSFSEKVDESFRAIKLSAKPWMAEIAKLNLPERIGRAIGAATPVVAEAMAKMAGHAAAAFARGFLAADAWGKLLIGSWLFVRMGGAAAAAGVGTKIATAIVSAMGVAFASTAIGKQLMKRLGVTLAAGAGAAGAGSAASKVVSSKAASSLASRLTGTATTVAAGAVGAGAAGAAGKAVAGRAAATGAVSTVEVAGGKQLLAQLAKQGIKQVGGRLVLPVGIVLTGTQLLNSQIPKLDDLTARLDQLATPAREGGDKRGQQIRKLAQALLDARKAGDPGKMIAVSKALDRLSGGGRDKTSQELRSVASAIRNLTREKTGLVSLTETVNTVRSRFTQLRHRGRGDLEDFRSVVANNMRTIKQNMDVSSKDGQEAIRRNFRMARRHILGAMDSGAISVKTGTREIRRLMNQETRAGVDALGKNFKDARRYIREAMDKGKITTSDGLREIRKLLKQELKLYGVQTLKGAGSNAAVAERGRSLITQGRQRGGPITNGSPVGDSVPAVLEKGEYVLNRKAVRRVGKQKLDQLNFQDAARFQAGGMIGAANRLERAHFPYVWGGGHSATPAPFGPMDCSGAVSFVLQHGGVNVPTSVAQAFMGMGKPGPGPVTVFANAGHTFMRIGRRYFGTSGTNPGGGAGWFEDPGPAYRSRFVQRHFDGGIGAAMKQIPRMAVEGMDSPLKSVVQGALDTGRNAANKLLEKVSASTIGAGDSGDPGPMTGKWTEVMARIAKDKHWNLRDWRRLVQKESGGNPQARNPSSGAYGLGQFLGATARAYAQYGALSRNPTEQIQAMAKYIGDRYGNPSAALAFHNANNWYRKGGLVEALQAGGPPKKFDQRRANSPTAKRQSNRFRKISHRLDKTLKTIRTEKKVRKRRKALTGLIRKLRDIKLPSNLTQGLATASKNSDVFNEYAERAGSLTDTDAITQALQDEMDRRTQAGKTFPDSDQQVIVNKMLGRVGPGNKTELDWRVKQLGALFKWRNLTVRAIEKVEHRRALVAKLITRARVQLDKARKQIHRGTMEKKTLEHKIKQWKKKPKAHKKEIRQAEKRIKKIDKGLRPTIRVRDALVKDPGGVISTLRDKHTRFNDVRSGFVSDLQNIQGVAAPIKVLGSIPAIGVLGGSIFETQSAISDLTTKPIRVTADAAEATAAATAEPSESVELLKQLLRESNLRTSVSQAQYAVFKDMPSFGGGGVVPGPAGSARVIEAHAGEGVFTREQMAAMGAPNVHLHFANGMQWLERFVDVRVESGTRRASRGASRALPFQGGR